MREDTQDHLGSVTDCIFFQPRKRFKLILKWTVRFSGKNCFACIWKSMKEGAQLSLAQ